MIRNERCEVRSAIMLLAANGSGNEKRLFMSRLSTRVSTTSWMYPFLLCIILFAKFISNFVISYHLYNCQGPGGWPSDRNAIARVTDDSIVGIVKGYTAMT